MLVRKDDPGTTIWIEAVGITQADIGAINNFLNTFEVKPARAGATALAVAIDLNSDAARSRAAAGDYGAPPVFPAGSRVFAAYRVLRLPARTETRWTLLLENEQVLDGTAVTQRADDDVAIAALQGPTGLPGGRYRLEVQAGATPPWLRGVRRRHVGAGAPEHALCHRGRRRFHARRAGAAVPCRHTG